MEDIVRNFLLSRKEKLCVLTTSRLNGKTEAAVVGYAIEDNLTIIMSTKSTSRKVINIKENPLTSFVAGFSFSEMNIQMDGNAQVISEGEEYHRLDTFFFGQNPHAVAFKSDDTVFIKFIPSWIRYIDHTSHPSKTEEKTF